MTQSATVVVPENLPSYPQKINVSEAFKLRFRNKLSFREIGERFGATPQAVQERLQTFTDLINNPETSSVYDENRANILTAVEFDLVKDLLDPGKRQKASLGNVAYAISQINNMIRLEKGQPTSITESLDADLSGLLDRIAPMKSAGSGSTVNASSAGKCGDFDTVGKNTVDDVVNQAIGLPTPPADRSIQGNLEGTNSAELPTKTAKQRKPRKQTASKSIVKSRKQDACNITANLNSKDCTTKQGTSAPAATDTQSTTSKEWYE